MSNTMKGVRNIDINALIAQFAARAFALAPSERECVALLGLGADEKPVCIFMTNLRRGKNSFLLSQQEFQNAVHSLAQHGVRQAILAHSHPTGGHTPSSLVWGGVGDVQGLGSKAWSQASNELLAAENITTPLLYLILATTPRTWGLYLIDENIGPLTVRRRRKSSETKIVPRGWILLMKGEIKN